MPIFVRLGHIKGQSTDHAGHTDWIIAESVSSEILRSISPGAKDQLRTQGETTLADVILVRNVDASSTKIQEACANGTFVKEVEIHLCSTINDQQEPYLKYLLKNVIVSSYSFVGHAASNPRPTEEVTLNFTEVEWTYVILDPLTGEHRGIVPGKYNPGKGTAS